MQLVANPLRAARATSLFTDTDYDDVARFFETRVRAAPTPLVRLRSLPARLGVADIYVKNESERFGMNAFKIVGVAYAVDRLLAGPARSPKILACATEGNHGRAVARTARDRELRARVYMRRSAQEQRVAAVAAEGADVVLVDGSYDDAVRRMAHDAASSPDVQIVSDTAWPGYEEIPRAIMAGYTWIMSEAARQWGAPPDVVVVQAGVGGLAAAVASWLADNRGGAASPRRPYLICAEPTEAACVTASLAAGRRVALVAGATAMAGLRCGEMSSIAFPVLASRVDASVLVDDAAAEETVSRLADNERSISAGPSGACGLAALTWWLADSTCEDGRRDADVAPGSRAFVINTEGATDPARYAR